MIRPSHRLVVAAGAALLIAFLAGCAKPADTPRQAANADQAPAAGEAPDPVRITVDEAMALLDMVNPTFAEFAPGYEDT